MSYSYTVSKTGVILSSESEEPGVVLSSESEEPYFKATQGVVLSSETVEPTIVADAGDLKGFGGADAFVFDVTAKGIVLSSESHEPAFLDPDGDGFTATDDLWKFVDMALDSKGGAVAFAWGDDNLVDQIIVSADSLDFV